MASSGAPPGPGPGGPVPGAGPAPAAPAAPAVPAAAVPAIPPVPGLADPDAAKLAWLDAVRNQTPDQISAQLYDIEKIYNSLPNTEAGAAAVACPIMTDVKQKLDANAHCSDLCTAFQPPMRHCLTRGAEAKASLLQLKQSLDAQTGGVPTPLKIMNGAADVTAAGNKGALNNLRANLAAGTMIGALQCVDAAGQAVTLYGATGTQPGGVNYAGGHRIATGDGKQFVPGNSAFQLNPANLAQRSFRTVAGGPVPLAAIVTNGGPPPTSCAAQRMIQDALAKGLTPVGMAEMWWGADANVGQLPRVGGHEYASCTTCRAVLATVLCPGHH